jgi:hypothetical protein
MSVTTPQGPVWFAALAFDFHPGGICAVWIYPPCDLFASSSVTFAWFDWN